MNSDDGDTGQSPIPNGDMKGCGYLRSANAMSDSEGQRQSFPGNIELVNELLPAGTNTLIGSGKDTGAEERAIVWFYHNSNGDHTIIYLDAIDETFAVVMQSEELNFSLDYKIYDAYVVGGGEGQPRQLVYTDGRNQNGYYAPDGTPVVNGPRLINVDDGINGLYTTIDLQAIELLKWPPRTAPTPVYDSVPGVPNQLRGKIYDFRYAYGYKEGNWSTYSPISIKPLTTQQEWASGPDYATPFVDNVINLTFNTGHERIRWIRLAVRVNDGTWREFLTIDKTEQGISDDDDYTYPFFDNLTLNPLGLVLDNNDGVPQVAGRMEFMQTNEIALGKIVEGYANVDNMDYEVIHKIVEIKKWRPDYTNLIINGTASSIPLDVDDVARFDFSAGDTYTLSVNIVTPALGQILLTYSITQADINAALALATIAEQNDYILVQIAQAWVDIINTAFGTPFVEVDTTFGATIVAIDTGVQVFTLVPVDRVANPLKPTRRTGLFISLKKGWTYYFAIQYYDRGQRDGTVQKLLSTYQLNIPWPCNESERQFFDDPNSPYYVVWRMLIDHAPPVWATHYQVIARKVRTSFVQRSIYKIENDPAFPNLFKISLEKYFRDTYSGTQPDLPGGGFFHQIAVGDNMRIVTKDYDTDLLSPAPYTEDLIDLPVIRYEPAGGEDQTEAIWVQPFDVGAIRNTDNEDSQQIEIYTPSKEENQKDWFEIGEEFRIIDANTSDRRHGGSVFNGTIVSTLNGTAEFITEDDVTDFIGYEITGETTIDGSFSGVIQDVLPIGSTFQVIMDGPPGFSVDIQTGTFSINLDQNIGLGLPAIILGTWGDVYMRQRDMGTGFNSPAPTHCYYYVEDPARSDFYSSAFYTLGRPAAEIAANRVLNRKSTVKHSRKMVIEGLTNGLSSFIGLNNTVVLNEKNGELVALVNDKKTLHCIQEYMTTPIYNGTYQRQGDGENASLGFDDRTFASIGDAVPFGAVHPGAVRLIGQTVFLYDYHRGTIAILTDGGSFDICAGNFKFKNEITQITEEVAENFDDTFVFIMHDEANKEVYFIFRTGEEHIAPVFSYERKSWQFYVDYPLTWAENLGTFLVSSNGTSLWKHGAGDDSTYYGEEYVPWVDWVFNPEPELRKLPLSMEMSTNVRWNVSSIIAVMAANNIEMESDIPATAFKAKEGNLLSTYFRDKTNVVTTNPALATTNLARVNGRKLRSDSIRHFMSVLDPDTEYHRVILSSVNIVYEISVPPK